MPGKLYTYPNNFKAYKIQVAAQYSGYNLELPKYTAGETNKSSEFLEKFPLGKVPAFEDDGFCLFETNAIAYYVGNNSTRGGDRESEVLQWIGVADNDLLPSACTWVYPTLGILQYNKQATEKAKEQVKSVLSLMNNHLLTRTFLVGERVTQADISMACNLLMLFVNVLEPNFREPYGNVNRWFLTVINQPQFKSVIGEVKLCDKMAQFDAKKYNEISGKGGKKEAAAKKKDEKKAQPKKETAKPDAGDQPPAPKPESSKNPWAECPKPSMDMDEWKRCYSNNPIDVYWPYFLENFKKEDYSIWIMDYKYNDELTISFMAANLINGMYQRLEKLRKHAFGCTLLIGENNDLKITGVWFWLGHELAFELSEDWKIDYEHYSWKKLDFEEEETKKIVRAYFDDDEDAGQAYFNKRIREHKVYK